MSYLESLFTKYGTDKGIWGYTPYYEEAMEARRFEVKNVLEIGICGYRDIPNNVVGASLFVWRDYFPNAIIHGVDNDGKFIFHDQDRIRTALCDAYAPNTLFEVLSNWKVDFDMIVDDAVHDPEPQAHLLNVLSPWLVKGGRYFVEEACPYKVEGGRIADFYIQRLPPAAFKALHTCVTHKPEELVIGIK
jgi:hypothetical protein